MFNPFKLSHPLTNIEYTFTFHKGGCAISLGRKLLCTASSKGSIKWPAGGGKAQEMIDALQFAQAYLAVVESGDPVTAEEVDIVILGIVAD